MDSIRARVALILETVPAARNDDNLLLAMYWMSYDNVKEPQQIITATKAETIMRTRRTIMNVDGLGEFVNNYNQGGNSNGK